MGSQSGFGPGFQGAGSKLYRAEYAAATVVIFGYLVYRWLHLGGLDWPSTVFWMLFPDLVAFIPIGLSSRSKEWPAWGSHLYDVSHTFLVWVWHSALYGSSSGRPTCPSSDGLGT